MFNLDDFPEFELDMGSPPFEPSLFNYPAPYDANASNQTPYPAIQAAVLAPSAAAAPHHAHASHNRTRLHSLLPLTARNSGMRDQAGGTFKSSSLNSKGIGFSWEDNAYQQSPYAPSAYSQNEGRMVRARYQAQAGAQYQAQAQAGARSTLASQLSNHHSSPSRSSAPDFSQASFLPQQYGIGWKGLAVPSYSQIVVKDRAPAFPAPANGLHGMATAPGATVASDLTAIYPPPGLFDPGQPAPTLIDAKSCRDIIANQKIANARPIDIEGDDWDGLEPVKQTYINNIFAAITAAPDDDPPYCPPIAANIKDRYRNQQATAHDKVVKLMSKPGHRRQAFVQSCQVYHDTTFIGEHGVDEDVLQDAIDKPNQQEKEVPGCAIHKLKASARLRELARVIQANKLLANDFVLGKKIEDMILNPRLALKRKVESAKSNARRKAKKDEEAARLAKHEAEEGEGGSKDKDIPTNGRKRKRPVEDAKEDYAKRIGEESDDRMGLEVEEEEVVSPSPKVRRSKRQKQAKR